VFFPKGFYLNCAAQKFESLGRIDAAALLLYAGSIAWVIGYDTIYAHQDAEDDALIGAVLVLGEARWPAWIGLAAFAAHLAWQIRRLEISCWMRPDALSGHSVWRRMFFLVVLDTEWTAIATKGAA